METRRFFGVLAVIFFAACLSFRAWGTEPLARSMSLSGDQWNEALAAFAAADREHAPPPGGVLFVGSSSIRLWDGLESQFADAPVVLKRGFGGSRLTDCIRYLDRLVIGYKPRLVLLYAGDNDIAEGGTPEQILERVKTFSSGVHARLPGTRVAFISIKPSPARSALIGKVRAANQLVKDYAAANPRVEYIDVFTPMVGQNGLPRPELFGPDRLHLSSAGYALWRSVIRPFVR
jgi:lysophospholipase L1-like esterase